MSVDLVLRATGHLTCLSTIAVFATAMCMAAVNASNLKAEPNCGALRCIASIPSGLDHGGLTNPDHIRAVAAVLWAKKT